MVCFKRSYVRTTQDQFTLRNSYSTLHSSLQSNSCSWTSGLQQLLVATAIFSIPFVFDYFSTLLLYHWTHKQEKLGQIPPQYPEMPLIGSTISFLWNSASFVKKATLYAGKLTSMRISLLVIYIYLVSEPQAIANMWKNPNLSSSIYMYTVGLRYIFGMHEKAIEAYTADDSGPYRKPHPFSNVEPRNRIDFLTNDSLLRGLTGPSMLPTFERFQDILKRNLNAKQIGEEWTELSYIFVFFRNNVGRAVLESLFGPSLLAINPNFTDDLWEFDENVVHLAKRVLRFFIPKAYRIRERLLTQIQNWYQYARQHYCSAGFDTGSSQWDPYWGSAMNQERQKMLLSIDGQDEAAVASTDLGLIWTSITNVVPSSMMTAFHIFEDKQLLSRNISSIQDSTSHDTTTGFEVTTDKLLSKDLPQSVYAKVLRLYTQSYITRCSAQECVPVGRWWLPRNEVSMVSSYVAHMNTEFWNKQQGKHPVDSFWADRFIFDSSDDDSKPLSPEYRDDTDAAEKRNVDVAQEAHFSTKGLSGAWVPYGGGFSACPGRPLAKRIILYTYAWLATEFDVEIRSRGFEMDSSAFGLGTQKPKMPVAFAIRRRRMK